MDQCLQPLVRGRPVCPNTTGKVASPPPGSLAGEGESGRGAQASSPPPALCARCGAHLGEPYTEASWEWLMVEVRGWQVWAVGGGGGGQVKGQAGSSRQQEASWDWLVIDIQDWLVRGAGGSQVDSSRL